MEKKTTEEGRVKMHRQTTLTHKNEKLLSDDFPPLTT